MPFTTLNFFFPMPSYNLLLNELLKHTWTDHKDYANLKEAAGKIAEIASFINEKKREAENVSRTLEIANKLSGKLKVKIKNG
jgi:FYVE/RhoGEF/PH domain-containing protein 5/6